MSLDLTYRLAYLFTIWGDAVNVVVAAFGALLCSEGTPEDQGRPSQRGCVAINKWGYMWTDHSKYCHRT